jgi:hypothetical protein
VGIKSDWLKILPPEGSYCYVAKAYVNKRGDGTMGRVTNPLNVRVGSSLNAMKTKVAAKLDVNDDVKILGEQDEYFKISPPQSVFLYVNKQFVELVKTVDAKQAPAPTPAQAPAPIPTDEQPQPTPPPVAQAPAPQPETPTAPPVEQVTAPLTAAPVIVPPATTPQNIASTEIPSIPTPPAINTQEAQSSNPPVAMAPATGPSIATNNTTAAPPAIATPPPTTKPLDPQADAESQFDQLEKSFIDNDKKPLDQQPIATLKSSYEKLAANPALPESLRRMCDYRLSTIKQRADDQQRYLAVKKSQEEMHAKALALQAEREELESRIKASGVKYFTAVGTLRVSSLQQGNGTLYRLTDPKTGRTVIYVRSDDAKIGTLIGEFIGIQGDITTESSLNLKVITPSSFEAVDQSKVNINIAAQVVPPSLMPTGTASTGNE